MTRPKALILADSMHLAYRVGWQREAAAELRRLSAEHEEDQRVIAVWRGRTQRAEAQRDALLEALRKIAAIENKMVGSDWEEIEEARDTARAAIKALEGENT